MIEPTAPPHKVLRLLAVTRHLAENAFGIHRQAALQTLRNFGVDPNWTPKRPASFPTRPMRKAPKKAEKVVIKSNRRRRRDWLLAEIGKQPGVASNDLHIEAIEAGHDVHITTLLNDLTALRRDGLISVKRESSRHPGRYWLKGEMP
jgi:hypothetical protein